MEGEEKAIDDGKTLPNSICLVLKKGISGSTQLCPENVVLSNILVTKVKRQRV